jgi:hypothetical protein
VWLLNAVRHLLAIRADSELFAAYQ